MVNPRCARPNSRSPLPGARRWLGQALLIGLAFCAAAALPETALGSESARPYATVGTGAGVDAEEALSGPDIRIILEEERTLYEFRQNGQLRMVRVEPRVGKPYYLVPRDPSRGFGDLMRADTLLPSWVLVRF